jgi:hypothetical protein
VRDKHWPRCPTKEESRTITVGLSTIDEWRRNESTDFFPRANTPIDLVDEFPADHLEEDDPGTRIQHLFVGGSVRLVLEVRMLTSALAIHADAEVVWLVDLGYSRREF